MLLPTAQTLKDNLTISVDRTDHGQSEETSHLEKCKEAALHVVLATEKIQQCQKQDTFNALKKLLLFIKSLVERGEVECQPGSFGEDLLEGYMEGRETTETIEERRIDAIETQKSDYENKRKRDMLKDIKDLQQENRELRQKVIRSERKETSFYSEKKILNETILELESRLKIKVVEKRFKETSKDFDITCATRHEKLRIKLAEENDELRQKIQNTETKTTALLLECERLKEDKCKLEKERGEEVQRKKSLETELGQKSDNFKVLEEQKDEKIKEFINNEIKLHANITKREEENAHLSKTLQTANDNFDKLMKKIDTEREMLVVERSEEKSQKEELKNQLTDKVDYLKQQLQQEEMKINDLTVVQNEMKSKEIEYQTVLIEKEQKINELVDLNTTMQKQQLKNKEDYEHIKMSLENENQRVQRQLDRLRSDLKAKSDFEKILLEEVRVLRVDLQVKKEHIDRISNQHENTKLQLTNEISAITQAQLKEKNAIEDRERTLVSELQNVGLANKKLNDLICKEQHARKENEKLITDVKEKIAHMEEEKTKLRTRLTKIAQDLENCTAENETMKNELEKIKSRKVIQIQVFSQSGVGLLSTVEDELKCILKSKMDVEDGVDLDIICCAKASDIQPNIPLLILCFQTSGLGSAVASTVRGLTLTPNMAVLIFHHKDAHALSNQASERVLTGQDLRSIGGIFDLAFLSGKGIYNCEMNTANFISIVNFIKREGTKRIRDDL